MCDYNFYLFSSLLFLRERLKPEESIENNDENNPQSDSQNNNNNTDNNDERITDSSGIAGDRYAGMLPPQKLKTSKFK